MPTLSEIIAKDPIAAILCSDIHLSHKPPIARSAEPDWYAAMARPLNFISDLAEKFDVPVVIAGDIFDKWNSPPELINFAMKNIVRGSYTIPGQHDLPLHNYKHRYKSAYWTLVEAGVIVDLQLDNPVQEEGLLIFGFPWGHPPTPQKSKAIMKFPKNLRLAVVHDYVCEINYTYPGAPRDSFIDRYKERLLQFDTIVIGDNHKGFVSSFRGFRGTSRVINCGTLMRRKIDEKSYRPHIGLLHQSGRITPFSVPCDQDKFITKLNIKRVADLLDVDQDEIAGFVDELTSLTDQVLDFGEAVKRFLDKTGVSQSVREATLTVLDEADHGR